MSLSRRRLILSGCALAPLTILSRWLPPAADAAAIDPDVIRGHQVSHEAGGSQLALPSDDTAMLQSLIDQGKPVPSGNYHISRSLDIWRDTTMTDVTLRVPTNVQQVFLIADAWAVSLVIHGDLMIEWIP